MAIDGFSDEVRHLQSKYCPVLGCRCVVDIELELEKINRNVYVIFAVMLYK